MTTSDYSLTWILPFVRESLRERSDYSFDNFIDGLWPFLARAGVPGIEKLPPFRGYKEKIWAPSPAGAQLAKSISVYHLATFSVSLAGIEATTKFYLAMDTAPTWDIARQVAIASEISAKLAC